jgi:hypothetical protein
MHSLRTEGNLVFPSLKKSFRQCERPAAIDDGVVIYAVLPIKKYLKWSHASCAAIRGSDDHGDILSSFEELAALKHDGEFPARLRLSASLPIRQGDLCHVNFAALHDCCSVVVARDDGSLRIKERFGDCGAISSLLRRVGLPRTRVPLALG